MHSSVKFTVTTQLQDIIWYYLYNTPMRMGLRLAAILMMYLGFFMILGEEVLSLFFFSMVLLCLLLTFVLDAIIIWRLWCANLKFFPDKKTEFTFGQENFSIKSNLGESTQDYRVLGKIKMTTRLIMLRTGTAASITHIIAWRDVPENSREELQKILMSIKAKLGI